MIYHIQYRPIIIVLTTRNHVNLELVANIDPMSEKQTFLIYIDLKTLCETTPKCTHWSYEETTKMCKLFGEGPFIADVYNNHVHEYELSFNAALVSYKISSEVASERQSLSLFHVVLQINNLLMNGIFSNQNKVFVRC